MPTTDAILYDDVLRLRNECERLRALYQSEYQDANKWNKQYCEIKRERDEIREQREGFRVTAQKALDLNTEAIRQRDDARRDLQFARSATVSALGERDKAEAERRRLSEIVTKQHPIIRAAEELSARLAGEVDRLNKRVDQEMVNRRAAVDQALQKCDDIGWRKNRLVEAIEKRGFVVRWQQDGTPEVLTKEQAAERERKAEEAKILREAALGSNDYLRALMGLNGKGIFAQFVTSSLFGPFATSAYGWGKPAEDKVIATKPTPEAKTATQNITNLADMLRPFYGPEGTYTRQLEEYYQRMREYAARKQAEVAAAEQPAPQPTPTGQPYYERAMKAVYGYVVNPATWGAVTKGVIMRLDAALGVEIRKGFPLATVCSLRDCPTQPCRIYHERPWKRD
jgi:hypothetical protein